jgi:glycosyltransferase involved in cell wall biosynthesis
MPVMYAAARAFAFPSEYEGFGIPLLEALSQGTPTVVSDIPPFHEVGDDAVVFFDGRGGVAPAAEILYNVVIDENMRLRFSERGSDRAKFFSWGKSARILRDLFRERSNH